MQNKIDAIDEVAELREYVKTADYPAACDKEREILSSFALYVTSSIYNLSSNVKLSGQIPEPILSELKNISDMGNVICGMNKMGFPREIIQVDSVKRKF